MLRFDAIGLGDSDGHWGDGSFTHKTNDVIEACKFMSDRGTPSALLVGHSFGGASVLAAARQAPGVRAVATVAAPIDPSHVEKQYDDILDCVLANGSAQWMVGGRELTLKRDFVEDVRAAKLHAKIVALQEERAEKKKKERLLYKRISLKTMLLKRYKKMLMKNFMKKKRKQGNFWNILLFQR